MQGADISRERELRVCLRIWLYQSRYKSHKCTYVRARACVCQ